MRHTRRSSLADRRRAIGVSQEVLAARLGVERSTVVRWEAGKTAPQPRLRPLLADALQVTHDQLNDLLSTSRETTDPVLRREFAGIATGLALAPLLRPRTGNRIGGSEVRQLLQRTARLRRLDDHLGGMDTYRIYVSEMKATIGLVRRATCCTNTSQALMGVLAEQAQLAGWAAFDAGRYGDSRRHYATALTAATQSQDASLIGNTLAFMAYEKADVDTATESCRVAGQATTPKVKALLHERLAWTHAVAGDADSASRALDAAATVLRADVGQIEPDWVFWIDPTEIEIMAGRCWTELKRPDKAIPILESALGNYDDTHSRDKALYLTWLAHSHLDGGGVEAAADAVDHAIDLTAGIGSVRPGQRIATVMRRLSQHSTQPAVAAVIERIRS